MKHCLETLGSLPLFTKKVWYRLADNPLTRQAFRPSAPFAEEKDVLRWAEGHPDASLFGIFILPFFKDGPTVVYEPLEMMLSWKRTASDLWFVGWVSPKGLDHKAARQWIEDFVMQSTTELQDCSLPPMTLREQLACRYMGKPLPPVEASEDASDDKTVVMTVGDLRRLVEMSKELEPALGRDLVHGIENQDSIEDIHANVVSTVQTSLVNRWLNTVSQGIAGASSDPEDNTYPDDDEGEERYAEYGFEH